MDNQLQLISQLPIFRDLPLAALQEFSRLCIQRRFNSKQMIYFRGQEGERTYLILKGEVKLYRSSEGRKVVLQILKAGDFFGNLSFTRHSSSLPAEDFAQAETAALVCVIFPEDLKPLLARFSELAMVMLFTLRNRLHQAESKIRDLAVSSARVRVINELIRYALKHGKTQGDFYQLEEKLTHQSIAEMTGLTRETVTKTLLDLEKSGFIEYAAGRNLRLNRQKIIDDCVQCLKVQET